MAEYKDVGRIIGGVSETALQLAARLKSYEDASGLKGMLGYCPLEECLVMKSGPSSFVRVYDENAIADFLAGKQDSLAVTAGVIPVGAVGGLADSGLSVSGGVVVSGSATVGIENSAGDSFEIVDGVATSTAPVVHPSAVSANQSALLGDIIARLPYYSGWDDLTDMYHRDGLTRTWDAGTRTVSVTHSSGFVNFWSYKTYFSIQNGDPLLSVQLGTVNRNYTLYFDNSGQLVATSYIATDTTVYKKACVVGRIVYSATAGTEILGIREQHNASEPNGISDRLHNTTGTVWSSGASLVGLAIGDSFCGIESGVAYDEDASFTGDAQPDSTSAVWPKYYLSGVDEDGEVKIERASVNHLLTIRDTDFGAGTGLVAYNLFSGGLWGIDYLALNEFCCMHIEKANSMFNGICYTLVLGQQKYGSISLARAGALPEVRNLKMVSGVGREATTLYTLIVKGDGTVQDVGNGTSRLDWRGVDIETLYAQQQLA